MSQCRIVFLVLLVAAVAGCGSIKGYVDIAREQGLSKEYARVLNLWTRSETVYSQFETRIHVTATYRSQEFARAYIKEYERIYLSSGEGQRYPSLTEPDPGNREFILYACTPEKDSNDFDKRDSIWKVYLLDERGNRIEPVDVRRIRKNTSVIESFFPYVNPYYGVAYTIRFPVSQHVGEAGGASPEKPLKLMITGVLGKVELAWN